MLQKLYSTILHKTTKPLHQKHLENQILQQHWEDAMLGKMRGLLPLPVGAGLDISIEQIQGLRKELNALQQRLSTLEGRKL